MDFWIATHHAHPDPDTIPWRVNLHAKSPPTLRPSKGDRVLFYETKKGRPSTKLKGRGAIVKCGTVTTGIVKGPISDPEWPYYVECDTHASTLVPLAKITTIISRNFCWKNLCRVKSKEDYCSLAAMAGCKEQDSN